ncbi:Outer membrane protein TolC [Williamwhitmania taraxaci]|uniref:Outer membrane protein TolC n=2 Tax=Williamwhitmania taraxaci TaxID=1640674 RepID=A0A1G6H641_9BACT|nr:Outer membrane protein TolC [Williamwhitmania taraxaci]
MTKSGLLLIPMLAVFSLSAQEVTPSDTTRLTFGEALRQMQSGNQLIWAANEEVKEKQYDKKATQGLFMPKIQLIGAYTILDDDVSLDLTGLKTGISDFAAALPPTLKPYIGALATKVPDSYTLQEQKFGILSVGAAMPLYAGGKIRTANKAASVRVKEAEEKLTEQSASLITELTTRYYGLRLAEDVITVRKEVLTGMESHVKQAESLTKNGMIASAEKLHAEVYRAEAFRALQGSVRDADIVRSALASTLGGPIIVYPTSGLFYTTNIESADFFRQQALANNPKLRQVAVNKELIDLKIKGEKENYLPTIALMGSKELYSNGMNSLVPDWFVGVGLNYTLFDGLARTRKVQAARSLGKRVDNIEEKAKTDIQVQVSSLYSQLMKTQEQLESIETSLAFANEYLRVREKSFSAGFATSLDVVDAQLNLAKVKIERLNLIYNYDITLAQLLEASGQSQQIEKYQTNAIQERYEK